MKPIQVGLMGLGTVGTGVFDVLSRNQEEIERRAGRGIDVVMVSRRDVAKAQAAVGGAAQVVADPREIVRNPDIDIVVELIGGYDLALAEAQRVAAQDQAREQTRRFLTPGSGYVPTPVTMFRD